MQLFLKIFVIISITLALICFYKLSYVVSSYLKKSPEAGVLSAQLGP